MHRGQFIAAASLAAIGLAACGGGGSSGDGTTVSSHPEGTGVVTLAGESWDLTVRNCGGDEEEGMIVDAGGEGLTRVKVEREMLSGAVPMDSIWVVKDDGELWRAWQEPEDPLLLQFDYGRVDRVASVGNVTFNQPNEPGGGGEATGSIEVTCPSD